MQIHGLLLLTLIYSLSKIEAGSQFRSCSYSPDFYKVLVSFTTSITDKQKFCCTGSQCANLSPECPLWGGNIRGQCETVGESKFCVTSLVSTAHHPGELCGGIVNDVVSTNATVPAAKRSEVYFSWLCCDDNSCTEPTNVTVDATSHAAKTNCDNGQYSMMCFLDNGSWSCTGSKTPDINDITEPIGNCAISVVLPGM
ncbi:2436_t:CDS:2 [Diversispora eburnea]|uniref:2436_t:CDS:1 n=1 Tax=Diversispora eburnea TaxID=1213867 RepID=A0A9N8VV78_9GLOM|nr:2436_t:CDS:2 [Diversispora eburnea]